MLVQHRPPAKNKRSQRHKAFLNPTERDPLDCTPSVHQLSANLDRGPPMKGASFSRGGGVKYRYHERQKEKGGNQEKKPPVIGSNPSRPPQCSSSKKPHYKKNKKGKKFQSSKDKPHAAILNKDNKLICSENERRIKEGLCTYCGGKHPIENASREPRTSLDNQEASLASREKPEWGS
ncbi:hypothetical protein O181_028289 [Austropuccinia psidii MF-1]|uniref:Uncharacterized protein n=1 Tax=Austropuccinia psidii MF-1 TaxID=1389203 RepID=A0A9Q3H3F2_9BASI|nr:hypothetical protein [Austropuccinia psidii MF-1]